MFHCRDETPLDNVLIPCFTTLLKGGMEMWREYVNVSQSVLQSGENGKSRKTNWHISAGRPHRHVHTHTHTQSQLLAMLLWRTQILPSAMQPYESWLCRVRQIVRAENNSHGEQMKGYQSIFCCINLRIWACWGKKERKKREMQPGFGC